MNYLAVSNYLLAGAERAMQQGNAPASIELALAAAEFLRAHKAMEEMCAAARDAARKEVGGG